MKKLMKYDYEQLNKDIENGSIILLIVNSGDGKITKVGEVER